MATSAIGYGILLIVLAIKMIGDVGCVMLLYIQVPIISLQ